MSRLRFHVAVKGKGDAVAVQNHSIILHLHFQEQVATINIQLILGGVTVVAGGDEAAGLRGDVVDH